jgi:hypothetical protein
LHISATRVFGMDAKRLDVRGFCHIGF